MALTTELTAPIKGNTSQEEHKGGALKRSWLGRLTLNYELRKQRSTLVYSEHQGPLRVQRPFYPEADGCCHTYILHPPGGWLLVIRLISQRSLIRAHRYFLLRHQLGKCTEL